MAFGKRGRKEHPIPSVRTSHRIAHDMADAARHADVPNPDFYDRPATERESPANLALSIGVLIVAVALALFVFFILR